MDYSELKERLRLHRSWRDSHGELNDAPNQAIEAITALEARVAELKGALKGMTERYVDLVNCGDCGNWNPETEDEVKSARTALENTNGQG